MNVALCQIVYNTSIRLTYLPITDIFFYECGVPLRWALYLAGLGTRTLHPDTWSLGCTVSPAASIVFPPFDTLQALQFVAPHGTVLT